jgi:hypothetical protein
MKRQVDRCDNMLPVSNTVQSASSKSTYIETGTECASEYDDKANGEAELDRK